MCLAGKLKRQFINTKISDMNTPDKLDNHVAEKFTRDRSDIAKVMKNLDEEISKDSLFKMYRIGELL